MDINSSFDAGQLTGLQDISAREYFYMKGFKQKIHIYFEKDNFIIKTATSKVDVLNAIKLRTEVFLEELGNRKNITDVDIDEYDIYSDHLLLIDMNSNEAVGTYRFNSNLFSNSFYSENEFNIYNILSLPGIKVELGRACIRKDFRGGNTLSLLWTGLLEYIYTLKADYLFGCSSISVHELQHIAEIYKFFSEFHFSEDDLRVIPRPDYKVKDLDLYLMEIEMSESKEYIRSQRFIPGLVKGYLSAGAKICGEPIYDKEFKCYDFFTFLDLKDINQNYVSQVTVKK